MSKKYRVTYTNPDTGFLKEIIVHAEEIKEKVTMIEKIKKAFSLFKDKISDVIKVLKVPNIAMIIGFLGAYAGSDGTSKAWRRFGIATVVVGLSYFTLQAIVGLLQALWVFTAFVLFLPYSFGHGVPDDDYPDNPNSDEGSRFGKFFALLGRKITKSIQKGHIFGDVCTRGFLGLLRGLSLISIPLLRGNWIMYILGIIGLTLINATVGWRNLGGFKKKIFNKEVEFTWADVVTFTVEGLFYYMIISWQIL